MNLVIVTGATGGLGPAVVDVLRRDHRCVLLARQPPEGDEDALRADLFDEASVRAALALAVARHGPPYALVHLAGGFTGGRVSETTTADWNAMLGLNLTAAFVVIRETLAVMRRDAPGRIVAVGSEAGVAKDAGAAAYTIAKAGLHLLVELTAAELADTPVTVNAVVPATLDTAASRAAMPTVRRVPLEHVASTIGFLLSPEAASVHGALIRLRNTEH